MIPAELEKLSLIPARVVMGDITAIPKKAGIYCFFFSGGLRILSATSYFELGGKRPPTVRRRHHLYTGAARDLRERMKQHFFSDVRGSNFRLTLLALERMHKAISRSNTPSCNVRGDRTLTTWLAANTLVGFELVEEPFERERQLLARLPSPFNIVLRRHRQYARALSSWRQSAFPKWKPEAIRRVRYR